MDNVTNKVIESLVVAETLVTAIVANNEKCPEHGALSKPVKRPHQGVVQGEGSEGQATYNSNVLHEVRERTNSVLLQALGRDGVTKILKGEGRGIRQATTTLQKNSGDKTSENEFI